MVLCGIFFIFLFTYIFIIQCNYALAFIQFSFNMTQTSFNCLKCRRLVFSLSNGFLFSISFYHIAVLTQESKYVLGRIFDTDNLLRVHMQSNTQHKWE